MKTAVFFVATTYRPTLLRQSLKRLTRQRGVPSDWRIEVHVAGEPGDPGKGVVSNHPGTFYHDVGSRSVTDKLNSLLVATKSDLVMLADDDDIQSWDRAAEAIKAYENGAEWSCSGTCLYYDLHHDLLTRWTGVSAEGLIGTMASFATPLLQAVRGWPSVSRGKDGRLVARIRSLRRPVRFADLTVALGNKTICLQHDKNLWNRPLVPQGATDRRGRHAILGLGGIASNVALLGEDTVSLLTETAGELRSRKAESSSLPPPSPSQPPPPIPARISAYLPKAPAPFQAPAPPLSPAVLERPPRPAHPKESLGTVCDVHVAITTYNRPGPLADLLKDLVRERGDRKVHVVIYDDGSDQDYSEVRAFAISQGWLFRRSDSNRGKKGYYRTVSEALKEAERSQTDRFLFIQDDMRLCADFFSRVFDLWDQIQDPKKVSLYLLRDSNRSEIGTVCWTGFRSRVEGPVERTQWVDCNAFLFNRDFLDVLGAELRPIPESRWLKGDVLSSGVGQQLSLRLHHAGRGLYRSLLSYVSHSEGPSRMNPKIRKRVPMTTESFADEKVVQKARYSDKVTAPALPEAGRKSLPSAQTVSVLIAAYRADKWLIESVNSVLSQELPPGWNLEVLVGVDGCPETLAVAQTIEDRRFGVVSFPVNSGTYVTFNSLVPLSRGSILVRHDADDVMLPTRLHKMIRAFEDPEVGRVTTWVAEKNVYPEPLIESPSKGRKIRDGTWSYRRDVFENLLGGFLPWRCAADTEMDLRSRSLGVKSHIVCEYLYLRRSHPGQLTQTEETGYGSALRKDYAKRIDELIIEYAANKPKPVVPTRVEGVRLGGLFSDKITASMASIPGRREGLEKVVRSLLPQVDHLNVYLNETPSIPGIEYPHTPDFLRHPKITAIWSRDTPFGDRGDAGKFYWADEVQGYHVICDDDLLYPSDFVETLIAGVERYGRKAAVGFHGAVLTEPFTEYYRSRRVYHFQRSLDADAPVHVLGSGTLAYHTSALVLTREDFRTANMADIWFGLKAQREEVLLVCLAHKEGWLTDDSSTRTDSIYAHSIKKAQTQKNTADLQTKVVKESWPWTLPVDRKGGAVCKSDPSVLEVKGPTRTARISVESGDHTHKFICATGTYYEFDLLHAVRDLKIEGLYVDVGANTGNHTTFFRLECPSTRVVAIEPDSENLAHLYRTIRLNDLEESVDVRPVAIHPTLSRVSMVQGIPKNKGTMRIEGEGDIEAQTLDRCLEGLEPALIKIDVEGLPLEVLRSGRSIVERCLPVIVCEANDHEASSIDAFLGDLGYERNPKRYCATATWIWQAKTG